MVTASPQVLSLSKSIAVPSAGLPTNYHVGNVFLYRITDQEWLCAYRYVNDHDYYTEASEDDGINDYYLKVSKSTDGGLTWNFLSDIVFKNDVMSKIRRDDLKFIEWIKTKEIFSDNEIHELERILALAGKGQFPKSDELIKDLDVLKSDYETKFEGYPDGILPNLRRLKL
jgi:hypothetical protein